MIGLLFWAGFIALFFDWRYMRRGGARPSRDDYRYLGYAIGVSIIAVAAFTAAKVRAEAIADLTVLLISSMLSMWGWRRYRIRKAHPVLK